MSDCDDDPAGSVARAHIRLEGALGSSVIDPSLGLFSLNDSSPAQGIAIQLLRSDSSPMTLEQDEPVTWLTIGDTRLDFKARYYQNGPTVTAGPASGALKFTISYR
ncbi:Fimbrial protein [compost metagenome]